nr:hypothetical protein [Erwinia sp. Ejp617]
MMNISASGLKFLYYKEAWIGKSCFLHFPGGASGVTIGPGYDMKMRSEIEIKSKMMQLGIEQTIAEKKVRLRD